MAKMAFTSELARVAFPIKPFFDYLNRILSIKTIVNLTMAPYSSALCFCPLRWAGGVCVEVRVTVKNASGLAFDRYRFALQSFFPLKKTTTHTHLSSIPSVLESWCVSQMRRSDGLRSTHR